MQILDPRFLLVFILVEAGLITALFLFLWVLWSRLRRYQKALSFTKDLPPTEDLIQQWKNQLASHPPGSPKYRAYMARLKAAGIHGD